MLAQHALLIAISSDLNAYGVVCEFDWNDGNGQEGWPPMDGSEGIRITDIDTSGIFVSKYPKAFRADFKQPRMKSLLEKLWD
ncbi:DUF2528 family protein, partial [Shigella flexneri]|nr:DUF2528 family protein [Shigella flexneri]